MLGEIWKIGDWSVFPAENTLRRDGSEVKVPPRLMDALIFFARHPDHVTQTPGDAPSPGTLAVARANLTG